MKGLKLGDAQQVCGGGTILCTTIAYDILSGDVTVSHGFSSITYIPGTTEYNYWYSIFLDELFIKSNQTHQNILNGELNTNSFNSVTYC